MKIIGVKKNNPDLERVGQLVYSKSAKLASLVCLALFLFCSPAFSHPIDMDALKMIESSGNPNAISPAGCRGLYQISEITLKHFNEANANNWRLRCEDLIPTDRVGIYDINPKACTIKDLFDSTVNKRIANWYLNWISERAGTVDDILICYNFGYGNWRKWQRKGARFKDLPKETQNYLKKYDALTQGRA